MQTTQVLIIGGGPSGLSAAAELSYQGIDCLLVEPRSEVSEDRPRAKTTSARTMEHLRRWGVADAVRRAAPLSAAWSDSVVFCQTLSGELVTQFPGSFGLSVERQETMAETGQQVPQPLVEKVLRRHLAGSAHVRAAFGHTAVGIAESDDGVTATVERPDGTRYRVQADYALGCDGPSGVTRRELGVAYSGASDPRPNFNVVFRAPELTTSLPNAVQYWVVGGPTPGVLGRLDLVDRWWAIAPGVPADVGALRAGQLIEDLVGRPVEHEVLATDPWTAKMLIADTFQSRRVFLLGESAHLNPPWGGHGYNTSVGDSVNVAWKLAAVLQGWAAPELLDSYEQERRPVVQETITSAVTNMSVLSNDLAGAGPGDTAERIQRTKYAEFHSLGLVLGYSYAGSPVVQPGPAWDSSDLTRYTPSSDPGARLPHAWLPDGSSLYDHLGKGLTLVGPSVTDPATAAGLHERAAQEGVPLTLLEPPSGYPFGEQFLLVRPDQHIAWRSASPDLAGLSVVTGRTATARAASA